MDMMSLRRRVMVNQNKLVTATGNPITFNTPLTKPLKECVVRFTPQQEGSGTPSPDNVRNISGRSSVKLWQSGKNIFGGWQIASLLGYTEASIKEDENGKYVTMGEVHEVSFPDGIFKENTQYTFIVKSWHSSRVVFFYIYYTDGTYTPVTPPVGEDNLYTYAKVTTANKTIRGIDIVLRSATRKFYFEESGFFEGVCTVDDFEPYKGLNEITFSWESEGQIFGGFADLGKGEVVAEKDGLVFDGSEAWYLYGSNKYACVFALKPGRKPLDQNEACSHFEINGRAFAPSANHINSAIWGSNSGTVFMQVSPSFASDITAFKQFLADEAQKGTPVTIVANALNPIHYSISPQSIATLKGTNTMRSDTNGDITIKYWTR